MTSGSGGKPGHPIESLSRVVEAMRKALAEAEKPKPKPKPSK